MADLIIKGIRELTAPHTIHVGNVGLNGVKDGFKAWDSAVGCAYEVVEVPEHGRLIDADELKELFRETITGIATRTDMKGAYEHMIRASAMVIEMIDDAPTVIEASEGGEQDG